MNKTLLHVIPYRYFLNFYQLCYSFSVFLTTCSLSNLSAIFSNNSFLSFCLLEIQLLPKHKTQLFLDKKQKRLALGLMQIILQMPPFYPLLFIFISDFFKFDRTLTYYIKNLTVLLSFFVCTNMFGSNSQNSILYI